MQYLESPRSGLTPVLRIPYNTPNSPSSGTQQ